MKDFTLQAKETVVADIKAKMEKAQSIIFLDYRGLTVAEVSDLRNKMRAAGVEYRVLKNTMVKRAAAQLGITGLDDMLEGPTGVAFGYDDPVAPAKILADFIAAAKKTEIKGGVLYGEAIDAKKANVLAATPSREQLLTSLVVVLNGVTSKFVRTLDAIRAKLEEGTVPAEEAAAE